MKKPKQNPLELRKTRISKLNAFQKLKIRGGDNNPLPTDTGDTGSGCSENAGTVISMDGNCPDE
ncbi:class I lanthipeptide [Aquimarina litoralis]